MNTMTSFITSVVVGFGLTLAGCATSGSMHDESLQEVVHGNSVDIHMAAIERHETAMAMVEEKILNLQKRITTFTQKPYLDPKGSRRSGWKLLKGTWQKEVNELRGRIAWHANELARLQGSANEHSTASDEESRIVAEDAPDSEWPTKKQRV